MRRVGLLLLPIYASATQLHKTFQAAEIDRARAADSCRCLSWEETYSEGKAACGDAFEFAPNDQFVHADNPVDNGHITDPNAGFQSSPQYWATSQQKTSGADLYDEWCNNFLLKVKSNVCVKMAFSSDTTKWYGKSWCYVSSECQSLNGGLRLEGSSVSAKLCTEAEDDMLSEMSPTALWTWYQKEDIFPFLGLLVKLAYPYMSENFGDLLMQRNPNATMVENFGALASSTKLMTDITSPLGILREAIAKGKPVVYDVGDHASTKYVVYGKELWKFACTECDSGWGDPSPVACVKGC